jgi:hypothetical protein
MMMMVVRCSLKPILGISTIFSGWQCEKKQDFFVQSHTLQQIHVYHIIPRPDDFPKKLQRNSHLFEHSQLSVNICRASGLFWLKNDVEIQSVQKAEGKIVWMIHSSCFVVSPGSQVVLFFALSGAGWSHRRFKDHLPAHQDPLETWVLKWKIPIILKNVCENNN